MTNKTLHISDSDLGLQFPILKGEPENIINQIKENHSDTDVFLTNVNYKTETISRADNAGILFLKYLRLHHYNQHCVLYSFLSREQLMMQDPHNAIIFSAGLTFIRMPEDLSKVDFEMLKNKKASEDLSAYFKAEFRLPDNRHFFANWWGVLQLWKVQQAVEGIARKTFIEFIESGFSGALKEMNSYDGLVARYVKGIHDTDIEERLRTLLAEKEEKSKNESQNRSQIQFEINDLLAEDAILEIQLSTLEEIIKEKKDNFLTKLLDIFVELPSAVQQKITQLNEKRTSVKEKITTNQEYIELINSIDQEIENIEKERRKLNRQIQSKIDNLISLNSFLTEDFSLNNIRQKLAEKKPTILFVDDQANDGWATIFKRMIYGGNDDAFTVFQPEKKDSIENIVLSIENIVKSKKTDLLILDLRLKGEIDSNLNINDISGICVLEKLIANHISCPILITSASNKIWSYKEVLKLGADAYWIKEGLDDNYSIEASIENYLRLIDLVYFLCFNEEYRFFYDKLLPAILKIKNTTTKFWWETKFWTKDTHTFRSKDSSIQFKKLKLVAKEEVIETLNAGLDLFKSYLFEKIQKNETIKLSRYIGSGVIIQFSRVLEIIHRLDENNDSVSLSEKMKEQLRNYSCNRFSDLIKLRNLTTHDFSVDFIAITKFIELFLDYLTLNKLDSKANISNKDKNTQVEAAKGEWYTSEIASKNSTKKKDLTIYFLKIPDSLILRTNNLRIILSLTNNKHLKDEELKIGDRIKFTLQQGSDNSIFR